MKNRALLIAAITILAGFASASFAVDVGGSLDASTSFARSEGYALYQEGKVTLWLDTGQEKNR